MKKHNYSTQNVNEINWAELCQQLDCEALTFAVNVAKAQQCFLLTDAAQNLYTSVLDSKYHMMRQRIHDNLRA